MSPSMEIMLEHCVGRDSLTSVYNKEQTLCHQDYLVPTADCHEEDQVAQD
eukprot:CCRYP_006226-RA/>CCRYP_006226-RA protein AED:0.31 eAED:1.00 QI:0/-1/0/1/-1/0/1/0/49